MLVMLAWFAADPAASGRARRSQSGFHSATDDLVPNTYGLDEFGGEDWSVSAWHITDEGRFLWPAVIDDGSTAAVSIGVPVGVAAGATPADMARRLLRGEDVHAGIVPPFGMVAIDRSGQRVAIQQDWLGVCRLFTGSANGITAFSNRPTMLAKFLHGQAKPSLDGWTSYALSGHFGGDSSPVESIALMPPGQRATCRRVRDGWVVENEQRRTIDDLVQAGLAARGEGSESALDAAAAGVSDTVASVGRLYDAPVSLGLSGGKDSRVIAAALVAAGQSPVLHTNNDISVEADVASELVRILADRRNVRLRHDVRPVAAAADVLNVGLYERTARLHRYHDFQYPASYVARPAASPRLQAALPPLTLGGSAGEIATGHWYSADRDDSPEAITRAVRARVMGAVQRTAAAPAAFKRERARVDAILSHAASLGLSGSEQVDYVCLVEKMRRWSSIAYHFAVVAPFLTPSVVSATFALTAADKRARLLHTGLIDRFVPEWSDIPYVSSSSGPSTASRVWDGDGLKVMRRLHKGPTSTLTSLLRAETVADALAKCGAGNPDLRSKGTLQTFTSLAVAARTFEPELEYWLATTRQRLRRRIVPARRIGRKMIRRTKALMDASRDAGSSR